MFEQTTSNREIFGNGENLLLCGNVLNLPEELKALKGKVQCVYTDPPFMTGERFRRRRPYGEKGWREGSPSVTLTAYEDRYTDEKSYLRLLRRIVGVAHELLSETGVFYLHLDWRMAAQARIMCDKVFGKTRFLNEIIWSYESGGRAKKYFSRKHDVILLYARGKDYRFDLTRVPLDRGSNRKNHMTRGTDEQGRMFSSIVSHGKEYRYYDDEPVYPGDVWTDIGHLQQRDPERTGYATQKPEKLLERLLLPVTDPGDWVVDLCCGSGTTLAAAEKLGCRYAGLDVNPEALTLALGRLKADDLTLVSASSRKKAALDASLEYGRLTLTGLEDPEGLFPKAETPLDGLESWETGTLEDGIFRAENRFSRSFRYPALTVSLKQETGEGFAIMTTDAAGVRRVYCRKD